MKISLFTRRCRRFYVAGSLLLFASLIAAPRPGIAAPAQAQRATSTQLQPSLLAYNARLVVARKQIPEITRSAEGAATRIMAHPLALIDVPYANQGGFAEELSNRAGGLSNVDPTEGRPKEATPDDVVLFSVRSWVKDGEKAVKFMQEYRAKGWPITLFASRAGMPADLPVDYFIDNGATGPGEDEGAMNAIVNSLNGWMWCCEYYGALTRHGKYPGVLQSVSIPGATVLDRPLQSEPGGRQWLGNTDHPIAAGVLADLYLRRCEQLSANLASPHVQQQIHNAADIVVKRLKSGRQVFVSSLGHMTLDEIFSNNKTPWKAFNSAGLAKTAFTKNLKPGDLLVWIGYIGMNSAYEDFEAGIRASGADLIACIALDPDPKNNAPWALAHIDQSWTMGDAVVPIPYWPDKMAPLSGVNAMMLYRMLDDEVSQHLPATPPATPPA
jgi:uncharacterized phosphosugar-binding protein